MTYRKAFASLMGLVENLRTLRNYIFTKKIKGNFSLYVCLSKFYENTRQYKYLFEYYRCKTYSSEIESENIRAQGAHNLTE